MAGDKYTSILMLKLQQQQQQQQQERAEALQREQMNDQMEMKSLDMVIRSGQAYFSAMKAADDRDLKLAEFKHKQDMAQKEQLRLDREAELKLQEERTYKKTVEGEKREYEEKKFFDLERIRVKKEIKAAGVEGVGKEEYKRMGSEIKVAKANLSKRAEGLKTLMGILDNPDGRRQVNFLGKTISASQARKLLEQLISAQMQIGTFYQDLDLGQEGGLEGVRENLRKVQGEIDTFWGVSPMGQMLKQYQTQFPTGEATPGGATGATGTNLRDLIRSGATQGVGAVKQ